MHYVLTALFAEAKPIIEHFRLKRQEHSPGKVPFFLGEQIRLAVSGPGPLPAAVAAACLFTDRPPRPEDAFFNIGICGTADPDIPSGTPVFAHKIMDAVTKRNYYPDLLVDHGLKEGVVETFPAPVRAGSADMRGEFADMEAAACMEAAARFLAPHQIAVVKIVSDPLRPEAVAAREVSERIRQNLPVLENLMNRYGMALQPAENILTPEDGHVLEQLARNWRLSVTMRHQLTRIAKQYKIRTRQDLPDAAPWLALEAATKREGKMFFEQFRQKLLDE